MQHIGKTSDQSSIIIGVNLRKNKMTPKDELWQVFQESDQKPVLKY